MGDTPTDALFDVDGPNRFVPTEFARGPWDPRACHGGPVAALLARAVERAEPESGIAWQASRLTIELLRPVPVGRPLTLATEIERAGKRVSLVAARLVDDDTEVARVRALRIREQAMPLPDETVEPIDVVPGTPDGVATQRVSWAATDQPAFHTDGAEHRFTEGAWDQPGPVAVWIRLRVPVLVGEEPSGVQRAVAAADFGNGVSTGLPFEQFTFINPDLTVHLLRPPTGEWIGLRSASRYGLDGVSTGAGMAESELFDLSGRVGRSIQSLLLAPR
jgi:hypothetical protein